MIPAGDRSGARDIALGLVGALAPVLADVAAPEAIGNAREVARGLGLEGLDLLLAACAPHAGHAWPGELTPALERLRRLTARTVETGSLDALREADRELAGLADEVAALQWSSAWRAGVDEAVYPVATLSLADTLDELPLADDDARDLARRVRLLPPVAAALRAALDWLAGDSGRPLALRAEDSLLEVQCEQIAFDALAPATEVLAAAGANLGPGPGPAGAWIVRVPLYTGRAVHLMLVHGGVPIAIPWHAVLRLHMAGAAGMSGREDLGGWPIVKGPLGAALPATTGEVPLALVAHGRKRGWIVADRLVWRLHAEPVAPTERAPAEGLAAMVQTEEGERYWLADPGWLLGSVEAPSLERLESSAAPAPQPARGLRSAVVPPPPQREEAPAPAAIPRRPVREASPAPPPPPAAAAAPVAATPAGPAPRLRLLTSDDVEPIAAGTAEPAVRVARPSAPFSSRPAPVRAPDSAPGAPARAAQAPPCAETAAPGPDAGAPAAGARPPSRTALVAEDSITARIFLARLLTRLGFDVRTVDTAAGLRAELERGPWSLACVDVELPDEAGTAFLAGLVARHGGRTPLVALVRDAADRVAARHAGLERMLRKPFDHHELEQVLSRLGLVPQRP